ncbi:MAG: hypothetical protein GX596_07250, partial [Propionibacterium sp.]|nr:hypothetical protein [Propionibacterium sp.]
PGAYGDPHTILVRDYGAIGFEDSVSAVVFGYDSSDEAAEGFALLQDAALDCPGVYEENSYTNVRVDDSSGAIPFDPPADMAAQVGYITAVGNSPATPDVGTWTEMVMLHADSRVLYVTQEFDGMDNNCSVAPDPDIEQCVLAAAVPDLLERLMRVS